jgi:predicted amidohydrolase YtcJ
MGNAVLLASRQFVMISTLFVALLALGAPPNADLVIRNAVIWTGDASNPEAKALAVAGGRILAVGTAEELKPLIGLQTVVIDAKGLRLVPGFYDSHVHLLGGGRSLSQVDLKDAKDEAEFGRRLKEFDQKMPRDRWLLGGNWDHDRTFAGTLPTAAMIDKYVPNRPVWISRYDGHMALANTTALKLAGVTDATSDPPGGVIFRLAEGKTPSGVLKDNAMGLVDKLVPEPGEDEIREAVRAAMRACAEQGVTSVQDMDGSAAVTRRTLFRVLQQLDARGESTLRVDLRWPISEQEELTKLGLPANFGSDFVRIGGVKGFLDGSLGSSTAKMFAGYVSDAKNVGVYVTEPAVMRKLVQSAAKAKLSVGIHAIGDQANAVLLDIFAENGGPEQRFRIEHAQHLRPADYPRFAKGGVIASMQPYHVIDDGRWAEGRIGAERCSASYAFRSLRDAKAVLAFGSDWPVAPLNVLEGLDAAVNRRPLDGKHPNGWFPAQRITVAEAVTAYTAGSAYAAFHEKDRGILKPGALADCVLLSRDIFDPKNRHTLGTTTVQMTIVGGRVVFERKK